MTFKLLYSPLSRISLGLVMLTVAIMLVADLLGFVPNTINAELKSRKIIAESLAIQLSSEIKDINLDKIEELLRSVVDRNEVVKSAAVRRINNDIVYEHGEHGKHWGGYSEGKSTSTHVIVPLFSGSARWGSVELTFEKLSTDSLLSSLSNSFGKAILFVALSGFVAYVLFLRRTMRELNPDEVIPERVRHALDTLSEGLMIVDQKGYIVFVNKNFAVKFGVSYADLVGKDSAALNWLDPKSNEKYVNLPWGEPLSSNDAIKGVTIKLKSSGKTFIFNVNASFVKSPAGKIRGSLITFDDITEMEAKNDELRSTLDKLSKSRKEIMRQNQELQVLATRDPLTGSLNRRSFFQGFEVLFNEAVEEESELSCIMVDIDHFKSINDRFGHATGDKVIKTLASLLNEHSRSNDLVGRLGGEEFCVVLPGADKEVACEVAERMRSVIQNGEGTELAGAIRITSSFGVASLVGGVSTHTKLLEQADQALYQAKESGRNRVISWPGELMDDFSDSNRESICVNELDNDLIGTKESSCITSESAGEANVISIAELYHEKNASQADFESHYMIDDDSIYHEDVKCLPSRLIILDRIDQAINRAKRFNTHVAVMVLDTPALKSVSDTMGYLSGEKLLITIVESIKEIMRNTDTVSVMDNNELLFSVSLINKEIIILLTDLTGSEAVAPILQRIFSISKKPLTVEGTEVFIGMNVGVSLFPLDGSDSETLIKYASSALHESEKLTSRNNFNFYSQEINQLSKNRIQMEVDLHHALQRDEFVVYYQPKVDLKTGDILGMEALIRWRHSRLGLVPPKEFISIAEHNGQITDISHWLIHTVSKQILHWMQSGYGIVPVSINISAVDFRNPEIGDSIIDILEKYQLPGKSIEVEITETAVMQNMDTAVIILNKLHKAGVSISIDDFGTGYSSLSYLKCFTLSKVKIDRSFITEFTTAKNDAALVSAIIAMGHSLGLKVVAEGVETDEQLRFLQDLHCDEIQGYLISRPVPAEEVSDLLARSSSIKRLITDYGITESGMAIKHNPAATTMIGILNDYDDSSEAVQA